MPDARDAAILSSDGRSDVRLTVAGQDFAGWTRVTIDRGIEQISGAFELGFTERWAGQDLPREILPGQTCEVSVAGELLIAGYIDDVETEFDNATHGLTVRGRDATGDLVDCAAVVPSFEFRDMDLAAIAAQICSPFRVAVRVEGVDIGPPWPRFAVQPGETAFEAIERACRLRGVLPVSDGRGGLILTKAGTATMAGAIKVGGRDGNVSGGSGRFSHRDRHSVYIAKGQTDGDAEVAWDADASAGAEARATDPAIDRYRPTIILAEMQGDQVSLHDRAAFARRVAAGRSQRATYRLPGWQVRGDEGAIWRPNRRVSVEDPLIGLRREMLIASVRLTLDRRSRLTELVVTDPAAFDLQAEPVAAASGELW